MRCRHALQFLIPLLSYSVAVKSQDTLVLINGQELPCDIVAESLHNVTVQFTQEQLINIYDKKYRFDQYVIRSLIDNGNQRKIKLGKVVLLRPASGGRSTHKFYSINASSVTVITGKYKDSDGYRNYFLESIPAQELEMIKWKNDKTAIGAAIGALSAGTVAYVLIGASDFDYGRTGQINGALFFGTIGAAAGVGIGAAVSDRYKIEHSGELEEWRRHYENIPVVKTRLRHN